MPSKSSSSSSSRKRDSDIRYSGDLELRLSFADSPLDRPSNGFREMDKIFSTLQRSASTTSSEENNPSATINEPRVSSNLKTSPMISTFHGYNESKVRPAGSPTSGARVVPYSSDGKGLESNMPMDVILEKSFFKQRRCWVYSALLFLSLMSLLLMCTARNMFGKSGDRISHTTTSVTFFISTSVITFLASSVYMMFYWMMAPQVGTLTEAFSVGSKRSVVLSDIGFHSLLSLFWFATLVDVGSKSGTCVAGNGRLSDDIASGCTAANASIGFGAFTLVVTALVVFVKYKEAKRLRIL